MLVLNVIIFLPLIVAGIYTYKLNQSYKKDYLKEHGCLCGWSSFSSVSHLHFTNKTEIKETFLGKKILYTTCGKCKNVHEKVLDDPIKNNFEKRERKKSFFEKVIDFLTF